MAVVRKLLKITETRPNTNVDYFIFHFENVLGYNVDNVYPGYVRHADVLADIQRLSSMESDSTDWGQEDGHHDHSVDGVACADGDICICGPVSTLRSEDNLTWTTSIKMSEAFPVTLQETNPLYEMRKAYNEEHGIVETVEIVSVDDHWQEIN